MFDSLNQSISQADLSRLTGRSEGRVSQWAADGTLKPGATGLEWLHAVINRLSEEAAGRASDGPLDLSQERAALARAQRELIEGRLARERGEYASITLLSQVLASASAAVAERLDALPVHLKRRCPLLPARAIEEATIVINAARNEWSRQTAELVSAQLEAGAFDADDDDADDQAEGAAA
jgi:phage terminase Nu1 subunit (DNA packaging protein)